MARTMPGGSESDTFRLADSASHLLHRAEQLAADRFALLVGENGLTLRQFAVMAAISETPGVSQAALVRVTGIDRSTVAEMMTRLQRDELIVRAASLTDKRANEVRLTPAGQTVLSAATQHAKAADAAILDALPRTKRKTFLNILGKLAQLSDKAAAKADREERKRQKRERKAADETPPKRDKSKRR